MSTQPVRLLIVDDCDSTRLSLRTLLSLDPTIEVIGEATNGQQAVQLVAEVQPDAVLIDGKMPIMDGLEATKTRTLLLMSRCKWLFTSGATN